MFLRSEFRRIPFVLAMASPASGCAVGPGATADELQAEIDDWIAANEKDRIIQIPSEEGDVGCTLCSYSNVGSGCEAVSCTCVS